MPFLAVLLGLLTVAGVVGDGRGGLLGSSRVERERVLYTGCVLASDPPSCTCTSTHETENGVTSPSGVMMRFMVEAGDLILGEPRQAALGLCHVMKVNEAEVRARMAEEGAQAVIREFEVAGTAEDKRWLRQVLEPPPMPEGMAMPGWRPLQYYYEHENSRAARLEEGHVLALRMYTTKAFATLNAPLRASANSSDGAYANARASGAAPSTASIVAGDEDPAASEADVTPHPFPCTMLFISDGIKKLRAVEEDSASFARRSSTSKPRRHSHRWGSMPAFLRRRLGLGAGEPCSELRQRARVAVAEHSHASSGRTEALLDHSVASHVFDAASDAVAGVVNGTATVALAMADAVDGAADAVAHQAAPLQLLHAPQRSPGRRHRRGSMHECLRKLLTLVSKPLKLLKSYTIWHEADVEELECWRGMRNLKASPALLRDGGSEMAPMSSTSMLQVAVKYALVDHSEGAATAGGRRSDSSLLFRIKTSSFMQRGADLSFLSTFPSEAEYLYPPLTYLKPKGGVAKKLIFDDVLFTVVDVEPHFPS